MMRFRVQCWEVSQEDVLCVCVCLLEAQLLTAGTRNCVLEGDALIFFIVTIVMVSYFFSRVP